MKYMHFNSSCSYAGLANLLELRGVDTEDYQIALDMGLPYFLRYEEASGAYRNGPMLQSAEWFDLYLKPRGFLYLERFMEKREESEEPDNLLLTGEECAERLPEQVVVGWLEVCEPQQAEIKPYLEDALKNWEALRSMLQEFACKVQSPQALKESMNRLFRPLLLDGLSMAKLLQEKELEECLAGLQKQFLGIVRSNEAVKLSEKLDCEKMNWAIDKFVSLIRLQSIRESERKSHEQLYSGEELYKEGGWLNKPIKTVTDLFPLFEECKDFRALDLGSGVGRNSIAIAKQFQNISCRIDCVDILELAIEKLLENAKWFGVCECINGVVCPIEDFVIEANVYDLILVVSALEHIDSEESLIKKLEEIRDGVKQNGVVCLVVNSEVTERNKATGEALFPQFEVNLRTLELQELLQKAFDGWKILKSTLRGQQYDIPRENCVSELSTKVVTFVVRK